jgi:hypothetical protein
LGSRGFAIAAALVATAAHAAEWESSTRADLAPGADTNALRETFGGRVRPDGLLSATVQSALLGAFERGGISASGALGGKLFASQHDADLIAARMELAARLRLVGPLFGSLQAGGKDLTERGHVRDYDTAHAGGGLDSLLFGLRFQASGGYALVAPRSLLSRAFSARGPTAAVTGTFTTDDRSHAVSLGWDLWYRRFPRWFDPGEPGVARTDAAHTVTLGWQHKGDFVFGAGYAFTLNQSTVRGAIYQRHRIFFRGALEMPFDITGALQGQLQLSRYPEGIFVGEQLLGDNDENQSSMEARLTRPMGEKWDLFLGLSVYGSELAGQTGPDYTFLRGVLMVGLSWRGPE